MSGTVTPHRLAVRHIVRMNGAGNAIAVLDVRDHDLTVAPHDVRAIAAASGFAFDQLMVIHPPRRAGTAAHLSIHNRDGSLAGACGNGTRCVAWVLARSGAPDDLVLTTASSEVVCHRLSDRLFSVDMGRPTFRWDEIPLRDAALDPRAVAIGPLEAVFGRPFAVGMGNPHAVFFVGDTEGVDLAAVGPALEQADAFPEQVNVSFATVLDRRTIRLRVWERGSGATLACGSGACATLVAAAATGRTERACAIEQPGGGLEIAWREDDHVIMTGPVEWEADLRLDPSVFGTAAA